MRRLNNRLGDQLQRLSVAQRLGGGFGFLMLLVLAMAASGGLALRSISQHLNQIVEVNNTRTGLANDLLNGIDSMAIHSGMMALVTDLNQLNSELAAFNEAVAQHEKVQQALTLALAHDDVNDPGRQLLQAIAQAGAITLPGIKKAVKYGYDGASLEATATLTNEVHANEAIWRKKVSDLLSLQKARTAEAVAQAHTANSRAVAMGGILLLGAALSGTFVALWTIRNNLKMMNVIAEQNATLESRVAERTAQLTQKTNDIAAMLQNMTLGVCTVVPGSRIHPEHSDYLRTIVRSQELAGQPLMPTIFGHSDLGVDARDQVSVVLESTLGEDAMAFEFNEHLLPREMTLTHASGEMRVAQMQWSPILNAEGIVEKILLIVQDVTHLRELEMAANDQRLVLETIADILKVPAGKFNEFIASCRKLIREARGVIASHATRDDAAIARLFRNVHTIKGNARTFGFTLITNPAHAAESTYDRLRKDADAPWAPDTLMAELASIEEGIERYAHINDHTLGRGGRASDFVVGRGVFLRLEDLARLQGAVRALSVQPSGTQLQDVQRLVANVGLAPMQRIVSGALDAANALAIDMGKPLPRADIIGGDIGFNPEFAEALKSSLIHIVRNALDHGIESPQERLQQGKPVQATLGFHCRRQRGCFELTIRDDGRGLALHKLAAKAAQSGLHANAVFTREGLAELIFSPGLSTAAEVSDISGRGVGMDAVRSFLEEQGANIRVELDPGNEAQAFAPFAFVIQVPDSACTLAADALLRAGAGPSADAPLTADEA